MDRDAGPIFLSLVLVRLNLVLKNIKLVLYWYGYLSFSSFLPRKQDRKMHALVDWIDLLIRTLRAFQYFRYGVTLEQNYHQRSYCRPARRVTCRLRRQHAGRHCGITATSQNAGHYDSLLRGMGDRYRLYRWPERQLRGRELHGRLLDQGRQPIDE